MLRSDRLVLLLLSLCIFALPGCDKDAASCGTTASDADSSAESEVKPAPEFRIRTIDGEDVCLSKMKGRVVLMDFWATWCTYCVQAMPYMQEMYDDYKDRGVYVLSVNIWDDDADPEQFFRDKGLTYPMALKGERIAQDYGVKSGIPVFFIIGAEGNIIDCRHGFKPDEVPEIRKIIEAQLKEHGM